jgi:hypothetical protein
MMGTTKVSEKGSVSERWGKTCLAFLEEVLHHHSKASAAYYYWNYYKYFKDFYLSLENLKRLVSPRGEGALVIQNSYYKEIPIPIPQIVIEMAGGLGISARVARSQIIRAHIGSISPRQARYVPRKILEECVVALNFR